MDDLTQVRFRREGEVAVLTLACPQALSASRMEDVVQSDSFSGIPAHWLEGSIIQNGLDPANLPPKAAASLQPHPRAQASRRRLHNRIPA